VEPTRAAGIMRTATGFGVLVAAAAIAGCHPAPPLTPGPTASTATPPPAPRTVQPGAPGSASRVVASTPAVVRKPVAADVEFMQGMIGHHAQAIEMVGLLKTRTSSQRMRLLGLRIEVSQADEIQTMRTWLRDQGAAEPDEHALHAPGARLMPGMLTPAEMEKLASARDVAFDRLFLEYMIKHHKGALVMVKTLLSSPGAAQESGIFAFAADVEADQTAEINRMRAMRAAMGK
jgi:uncharacterized protein (DUF305 family)